METLIGILVLSALLLIIFFTMGLPKKIPTVVLAVAASSLTFLIYSHTQGILLSNMLGLPSNERVGYYTQFSIYALIIVILFHMINKMGVKSEKTIAEECFIEISNRILEYDLYEWYEEEIKKILNPTSCDIAILQGEQITYTLPITEDYYVILTTIPTTKLEPVLQEFNSICLYKKPNEKLVAELDIKDENINWED